MDQTEPKPEGHHRSARERQRRGPMWGCLRALFWLFAGGLLLLLVVVGGGWFYLGTSSFADLVKLRVEKTLEARLGRDVSIGGIEIVRSKPQKVILKDIRIANAPGAVNPYFATVKQLVITGGVDSFWGRRINVDRIDIIEPHLWFEVFPAGSKLVHNFPHWQSGPRSRFEIYHLDLNKMFVRGGAFDFLDRRHDMAVNAVDLSTDLTVTGAEDIYAGVASSPKLHVRIQDFVPFDMDLRGGFRYTPGALALQSVAMQGDGMRVFLSGKLDPLAEGAYQLHLTSQLALRRVRDIFKVNKTLDGDIALDGMLQGKQGEFTLAGKWLSPKISADVYDLTQLRGQMNVTGERTLLDVDTAKYGGGTISAHYALPTYAEPYPMSVELHYDNVSLEHLFGNWGIEGTGLRGGATGRLAYHWNKDKVLAGAGEGTAHLTRSAAAFSNAKYPVPLAGDADFTLDNGTVFFRRADLDTGASKIALNGKFRIEDAYTDLRVQIHSSDFSELDRIGYNFAHSAGKKTYDLLGLGGAGEITGSVVGRIKAPVVVARVAGTAVKYNNVALGDGDIDLHYDGPKSLLTFDRAVFRDGAARLTLTGTIAFPDQGPSPRFDLAVDAAGYPIDRAMATVNLKLAAHGNGTGRLIVTGTPDEGRVHFVNMLIAQGASQLRLNGDVAWAPGKGNTSFDLDIGANAFPVADIITFLDLGTFPVTGELTGTLHLQGPKNRLEGAGSIMVRKGSIYGEPVDKVTADIAFTQGKMKATNVNLVAPAGSVTGEAELNLETNQFSYSIKSSSLDLSKVNMLSSLKSLFGGKLVITSTGAGTLTQPELVVEATLNEATLRGLNLPADAPPPTLYIAIRNGQLVVRGSAAGVLTIEGNGSVGTDGTLAGLVRVTVTDIAKLLAMSPSTATLPAAGNFVVDLTLGGKLSPFEAMRIDASFPVLNLRVSEHEFNAVQPPRIALRDGRIVFESFELQLKDSASTLAVTGNVELTGGKRLDVNVKGLLEAALAQLFVPGLRADGHVAVAAGVHGTLTNPILGGTAEFQHAQFRFPGFPQLFDNITGTLVFKGDRIDIDSLRADVGGGQVIVGGSIGLNGLVPDRARLTLQGREVSIRYFEGLTVEGNFNLLLSGDAGHAVLNGDVDVTRALYFKDFDFRTSLLNLVLSRRGVTPVVGASWQDRVALRLHLSAPETLAVRNNLADVTGNADLYVNGTLANPVILGLVNLDEGGRVRFQNIDYRVVRGSINFQNPFRIDPYFDITVEGRISGGVSEIESGPVDVTVNLTGTLDRLSPTITSDPPASDITLFSLLGVGNAFSRGGGNNGTTSGNPDAAQAGRSILQQSLISALGQKILPFADSFTYDPGLLDTSSDPGAKVSFEKRLSNDIRVIVVYNLTEHRNRELIEWQVNPEWTLQFTRDETRAEYRLEGRFRRRYEAHWAWGKQGRGDVLASFASLPPVVVKPVAQSEPPAGATPPQQQNAATPEAPIPADAPRIASVDFHTDATFNTQNLPQYVAVKPGDLLTTRNVQQSIKTLYSTGDFRDVRVDSTPAADGSVALTFALFLNYRVAAISFDGLHGADRERAGRELTVRVGDVLSLNAVDHSAVAVTDMLHRAGFLEATVDPETTFQRDQSRASVIFHVAPGATAKVGTVDLAGDIKPFTAAELIGAMHRGPGKTFQLNDARRDADRMRFYAVRRDYRRADIRFLRYDYDPATKLVTLRYRVTIGPKVRVEVEGVPRSAVRGLVPFTRTQAYSEDVIDRAADDIVRNYQEHGYYNAAVDTESALKDNVWTTTFHVVPGQRYHLTAVTFTGNAKLSDKTLAGVIATSTQGGFRSFVSNLFRRPTGVTRTQLGDDRDALESYYMLQGFSEAKVADAVVNLKNDGTMTVDFPITEGPQTLLANVKIEGNEQVPAKELPPLQLHPGEPLNPQLERNDIVALQSYYADRGNTEVQITPRQEIAADKTSASVTYVVAEGPRVNFGDVIVRGNTYTRSNVVTRSSDLERGNPFSYRAILEAQRNLYRLGIFQRVEVQAEQAGTTVADRNVVIQVEEGKDLTVSGSVGVTSGMRSTASNKLSLLGSMSIAHRNIFGTGRYLGLEIVASPKERQEVFLTEREPFFFGYDVPVQFTVFQSEDFRKGEHLRQRGTYIEAAKIVRNATRFSVRYEYKISRCIVQTEGDVCDLAKRALIPGVDRNISDIDISSITPTVFWDHRDDPIDPHRGFFTSASLEYAHPLFAAKADFAKEFTQATYYLPVSARSTFAVSGRLGLIQPLGSDPDHPGDPLPVPLSERFTGGGDNSHRAFPLDLLGTTCADPRDFIGNGADRRCEPTLLDIVDGDGKHTIAPIGGNSIVLLNAEYRFPIFSTVGGAVFTDIGNVFAKTRINFGHLRYGVGTGIRYVSAVGPIRFDVAYKLGRRIIRFDADNKPVYESPIAYFITLGYAF